MRRISLNEVTDDMTLAKPIYQGTKLILQTGVAGIPKYKEKLNNVGIFSVYVNDPVSDDISVPDVVCEQTREKCKATLRLVCDHLRQQGNFHEPELDEIVTALFDEIFQNKDILICLSQISTADDATMVHSINTTIYSILIGIKSGLPTHELKELAEGALLHDLGKIILNESILLKSSALTQEEFNHIKQHPSLGYEALEKKHLLSDASRLIVLQHHERLDGSGYPAGLKGDEIHPYALIVAIADVYDALTSERCYRKSLSNYNACKILKEDVQSGKLNSAYLSALLSNIAVYPNGIVVYLSDGTHGIVKAQNPDLLYQPVIRIIDDRDPDGKISVYDLDLATRSDVSIIEP